MGSSSSSRFGFSSSSFASAMRICQPPENFLGAAIPIRGRKAQPGQHGAHLRLDRVAIARAEFAIELMKTVGHLRVFHSRRIKLGHLVSELFHLPLHVLETRENRHALAKDAAAGKRQAVLRQVSGADALGGAERAVVERFHPRQHLEQRGFAGAIGAHQAGAVFGR